MRIEPVACNNGLGAMLRFPGFTPAEWSSQYREYGDFRQALAATGIPPEFIDDSSLQVVHEILNSAGTENAAEVLEDAQSFIVASGIPPQEPEVIGLRLIKAHMASEEELDGLKS